MREQGGPYQFTEKDLELSRLRHGAEHTLNDFYARRDGSPQGVARRYLDRHLRMAFEASRQLSLDTSLLRGVLQYFASRRR